MEKLFKRLIAFLRGTFVADCPVCHKHFFGYHKYGTQINIRGKHYRIICHRCMVQLEDKVK